MQRAVVDVPDPYVKADCLSRQGEARLQLLNAVKTMYAFRRAKENAGMAA